VKLITQSQGNLEKGSKLLKELRRISNNSQSKKITTQEFNQILMAYEESKENELQQFFKKKIRVGAKKREVIARTHAQFEYVQMIEQKDIVFGIGPAGTGKTYIAMAMAISELLKGNTSRIILTRPAIGAGENLGFLPGSLEDKIMPYLRPLYDALYEMLDYEEVAYFIEKKVIEVAPLAFMRGRTLNNAFVILDEAQNTTPKQMMMFLTRLGFESRCIITGDPSQNDLPKNVESGLIHATRALKDINEIGVSRFKSTDVVRHPLVEKIINAYQKYDETI
jgi:phosphate starvation-inducible PhoH-like protein